MTWIIDLAIIGLPIVGAAVWYYGGQPQKKNREGQEDETNKPD